MNSWRPPNRGDQLRPGRQQQVEGVAEDQLVAELGDLARLERLDRPSGRERDERGRPHVAVRELERAAAGQRLGRARSPDREHDPDVARWRLCNHRLMGGPIELQLAHTADLDVAALEAARALLYEVFGAEMTERDWEHALGGVHALRVGARPALSATRP